jgi:hypothetical protein
LEQDTSRCNLDKSLLPLEPQDSELRHITGAPLYQLMQVTRSPLHPWPQRSKQVTSFGAGMWGAEDISPLLGEKTSGSTW